MEPSTDNTEYTVSIRITFPEDVSRVLKQEKGRFVAGYGSGYKSEPHITLYLARYTEDGFPKLLKDLRELSLKPFTFSLLEPEARREEGLRRNLYVVDVSNKEELQKLHEEVSRVAVRYESPLLREKEQKRLEQGLQSAADLPYDPHITLGEVGIDAPQPNLTDVRNNLKQIEGAKITVSSLVVFFYGKEQDAERAKLIEEVRIPFRS